MGDISQNFDRDEFRCKGMAANVCDCGFATVDVELLDVLERVRANFNKPVIINSGCRCEHYNTHIKGAKNSMHMRGIAADIVVDDTPARDVQLFLKAIFPNKYGIGCYAAFTHIDVRPYKARW